ncbi:MAG: class I SAM-dependent methyltransferase [Nanoarchaeota archaeon]
MKSFDVETYKKLKGDFNNEDEELLLSLLASKKMGGRVLDIGCGDGSLTLRVKQVLPTLEIIGIDNSPEQISLAQKNQDGISFILADIINYRMNDTFDYVYSFYCFPHIPKSKLNLALASVRKLLKNNGKFYLFTNICQFDTSKATLEEQEACDVVFLNNWPTQINLISLEEMRTLFRAEGFTEIENKKLTTGAKIKSYGDMISWLFILK